MARRARRAGGGSVRELVSNPNLVPKSYSIAPVRWWSVCHDTVVAVLVLTCLPYGQGVKKTPPRDVVLAGGSSRTLLLLLLLLLCVCVCVHAQPTAFWSYAAEECCV